MQYTFQFGQITRYLPDLLAGALISLEIAFVCFWGALLIGLLGAMALHFGGVWTRRVARAYVACFTNTPGLVQIYFIYFALPEFGILFSSLQAVIIGITLNAGGYLTLILKSGFLSVHRNELDAAEVMGMSRLQLVRYIIVPHIARVLFPPISNKFILMVLGTAVAGVFGVEDLMGRTINANAESFRAIELLSVTACLYVAMTILATLVLAAVSLLCFGRRRSSI